MELINYYLQDDKLLSLDNNLLRYKPIKLSECYGKDYYDNVVNLMWDLEEVPEGFIFPNKLKRLSFLNKFNKKINFKGLSLTHLILGDYFNQSIDLIKLPLTHLRIGYFFDKDINLPQSIIHLEWFSKKYIDLSDLKNLKSLNTHTNLNIYKLKKLTHLSWYRDQDLQTQKLINLEYLRLGDSFNRRIDLSNLIKLKHLEFGVNFNCNIDLSKLVNLKYLKFKCLFNKEVDLSNLINLEYLIFNNKFNKNVDISNLINLKYLEFGWHFNYSIDLLKLTKLKHLRIHRLYTQKIINVLKTTKITIKKY